MNIANLIANTNSIGRGCLLPLRAISLSFLFAYRIVNSLTIKKAQRGN